MSILNIALCQGRHEITDAVDGAIFRREITDVTDTEGLEEMAFNGLWDAAWRHHKQGEPGYLVTDSNWDGCDMEPFLICRDLTVNLYVTGLTVALIAALNVCRVLGLKVTLYHYNRETGSYYPQEVKS